MKPMVKEISIMLLILIIIILGFGIVLYDYIPSSQGEITISKYEPSEDTRQALEEIATSETTNVILTYEVTDVDLDVYENTKSYNKGKANPFSAYSSSDANANNNSTIITNNNSSNNNVTTNNNNQNTTNTFYETNDTK